MTPSAQFITLFHLLTAKAEAEARRELIHALDVKGREAVTAEIDVLDRQIEETSKGIDG